MTVQWNVDGDFAEGSDFSPLSDKPSLTDGEDLIMAKLLWAMRKTPETRAAMVAHGRRLLADPGYPPDEVLKKVAELLAGRINHS